MSYSGTAAVVAAGEQDIESLAPIGARPVLSASLTTADSNQPAPDRSALVRRVFTALLPKLAPADKRATPIMDAAGNLVYTPTEPGAGTRIHDLPPTVQGQVLCTVALRESGLKAEEAGVRVNSVGECVLSKPRILAKVHQFAPAAAESSSLKIAGRPADERTGVGIVVNLLTVPTQLGRTETLTLQLRRDAPSAELRSWAEKVANAVLVD